MRTTEQTFMNISSIKKSKKIVVGKESLMFNLNFFLEFKFYILFHYGISGMYRNIVRYKRILAISKSVEDEETNCKIKIQHHWKFLGLFICKMTTYKMKQKIKNLFLVAKTVYALLALVHNQAYCPTIILFYCTITLKKILVFSFFFY